MKKIALLFIVCFSIGNLSAQNTSWGVKGGLNYNQSEIGLKKAYTNSNKIFKGQQANNGWHLGLLNRTFLSESFFLQFEGLYSETSNRVTYFDNGTGMPVIRTKNFNNQVGQLNILAGIELINFLRAQGGLTGKFTWDNEFSDVFGNTVLGYNLGVGINLGRINLDAAYNGSFTNHNGTWNSIPLSYSDSEIVFSVTYIFIK